MVQYKKHNGNNIAIIKRKQGTMETDKCPFCGSTHIHGLIFGHRIVHCQERLRIVAEDGIILDSNNGYFIEHYDDKKGEINISEYLINYANDMSDLVGDIPNYSFTSNDLRCQFLLGKINENSGKKVFLLAIDVDKIEDESIIFIGTRVVDFLHITLDMYSYFTQFHLHEYESFEAAYEVALSMRETHPLCYDK